MSTSPIMQGSQKKRLTHILEVVAVVHGSTKGWAMCSARFSYPPWPRHGWSSAYENPLKTSSLEVCLNGDLLILYAYDGIVCG